MYKFAYLDGIYTFNFSSSMKENSMDFMAYIRKTDAITL